jgi:hypothetical protein
MCDSFVIDYNCDRLPQSAPGTLLIGKDVTQRAEASRAIPMDLHRHSTLRVDRR